MKRANVAASPAVGSSALTVAAPSLNLGGAVRVVRARRSAVCRSAPAVSPPAYGAAGAATVRTSSPPSRAARTAPVPRSPRTGHPRWTPRAAPTPPARSRAVVHRDTSPRRQSPSLKVGRRTAQARIREARGQHRAVRPTRSPGSPQRSVSYGARELTRIGREKTGAARHVSTAVPEHARPTRPRATSLSRIVRWLCVMTQKSSAGRNRCGGCQVPITVDL
jgi:hypothetical protein